jgi:nucleotide-binding universal stress UspA family protein
MDVMTGKILGKGVGMMRYLVGYNGSDVSKAALSLARTNAELSGATVFVVTSMGGGSAEKPEEIAKVTKELEDAEIFLKEKEIPCEIHQLARGMTAGEDLVSFAEENDIDRIYVGVEKKSRTQKIIVGSTAQFVILKAPCPVVSVNRWAK